MLMVVLRAEIIIIDNDTTHSIQMPCTCIYGIYSRSSATGYNKSRI